MRWRIMLGMALAGGCSSIPTIRFMDVDGEAPDGADVDEGVEDAGMDVFDSGTKPDGPADSGTCPGVVPMGATTCCGAIPCGNANCGAMACTDCALKCVVGSLCCPNMGKQAVCILEASTCP